MDPTALSHRWSPVELKAQLERARDGAPFLVYRAEDGQQRLFELGEALSRVTIGRGAACDVALDDGEVSLLHAELTRLGAEWVICDDGLSRNGSFINGAPIVGRRRLRDGDAIRVGATLLIYRTADRAVVETEQAGSRPGPPPLSATQRRILVALCRPFRRADGLPLSPTNRALAREVSLSEDRVKAHLRAL